MDYAKKIKITKSLVFADYYTTIVPNDFGLTAFTGKEQVSFADGNWQHIYTIQGIGATAITIRLFVVASASSSSLSLYREGTVSTQIVLNY